MNRATKNKQQFQALLLDVDGTMAETERDGHRVAFNRAFADFDLDWCWSEDIYGQLLTVAGGKERIQYFIDTYHPALPQIPNIQEFIIELHQHKTAIYNQILHDSTIPLRPGIARLLQEAKEQGIMLGIVTTTSRTNVESLINTTLGPQALNWFAVIGAGNQVTAKKPAPDIYQYAMQQLGLPPQSCIAIEDSAIGLNSALSAGIPTVIVTVTDYTREQNLTGATLVVENLGDSEHPCQVLAGAINSINLVDIPLLKSLHETPQ
ncbi:CbbY [Achromatium sp. WMS2]|nr:CbbY [Achromatium sp. WMS2]